MLDVLIIEPNPQLVTPYSLLTSIYHQPLSLTRVDNLEQSKPAFLSVKPDLVLLSGSFAAVSTLDFLQFMYREMPIGELIPLIWIVDVSQPLSQVLGTAWGGKVSVLSSVADVTELRACLFHLFSAEFIEGSKPAVVAETIPDDGVVRPGPFDTFVKPK